MPAERKRRRTHGALLAFALGALVLLGPRRAFAIDQQVELESARQLYIAGKSQQTVEFLTDAIDSANPTITEPELVARGRMIRGAAEYQLGRRKESEKQWRTILEKLDAFRPDPLLFPQGVLDEFDRVRERVKQEKTVSAGLVDAKLLVAEHDARVKLEAKLDALKTFASTEYVTTRRSRIIASIPFGVGQLQNGDESLGITLLILETIAGAVSIGTGLYWANAIPAISNDTNKNAESNSRLANEIAFGVFFGLAVAGVVQAHVVFVPESREPRARKLPPQLALRWMPWVTPLRDGATFGVIAAF